VTLSADDRLEILDVVSRADATVSSVLLIVDLAAPSTIRTAAAITQALRRTAPHRTAPHRRRLAH
jgi:hypothetical protein